MELVLTNSTPTNTDLATPDGRVLYTIATPLRWTGRTTTVTKHTPEHGAAREVARIQWGSLRGSQLVYDGQKFDLNTFISRTGPLSSSRSFVGPDGRIYKWKRSGRASHLQVDDKTGTVIASFHPHNVLGGGKSSLEIDASALPMLDLIIITWIYIEKKRRDAQAASAS